jgi:prepilin-type N-terminal cleavage/methylation domain-containing protein
LIHRRHPSSVAQGPRATRAFTLVEILVVIVILGIISAVIVPQIGSRADIRCAAAARRVMADLIYAQNLAIARQQTHYVRFAGSTYGLYTVPTGGTAITHPVEKTPYTATFGAGGTSGLSQCELDSFGFDGRSTLAFDELGAPYSYDSGTNTIVPLAAAGQVRIASGTFTMTIGVEPFTGELTVATP